MKYTIIIQWSKEDECYVVSLPDFTDVMQPCTHGDTYEEALKNAQEVLEMLISSYLEDGQPIPEPQILGKLLTAA
ncbi:type II toxin-antitoxin system HicB family antitoxin [Dolichospermum circinale CS-1225]|uniref:Type II toxin-antitoxin system HicB family antitoxin n=1 Tax=Dolichospermum circinale CS-537/01 TaxID=3021739 RepID=A0ABT5A746_9CYAN|nr:type II toxin-antitoxin system HicB family antitoxin [Dolichospermum circinale]MDB9457038.1 type II toxin-antitoxin system HicB family antitoxin [Dolichospermum circinale CS-545/17]MDB9465034.1 type II toxin-antitoxin system HicB family antitoxin [Dolichospermum circinale CS-539/09]MDB9471955.1 type II toxin-antitoxin system HicB family antitoxin [Dolichospermum circinale CS-539]MDB9487288.1 type II toxin-antitoxin system HicB family antitoxin [Dolichospermum circinale CS-537/01]MDB9524094.